MNSSSLIGAIIYIAILFIATFTNNNQWGFSILSAVLTYIITTYGEDNYLSGMDLAKEYIVAALLLIPLIYPAYYIVNKSMYLEPNEED